MAKMDTEALMRAFSERVCSMSSDVNSLNYYRAELIPQMFAELRAAASEIEMLKQIINIQAGISERLSERISALECSSTQSSARLVAIERRVSVGTLMQAESAFAGDFECLDSDHNPDDPDHDAYNCLRCGRLSVDSDRASEETKSPDDA